MQPPDGVGRCATCTFPAGQMLFERRCIACRLRCDRCKGKGRERIVYRFSSGRRSHRYAVPRQGERQCQSCRGSGRAWWAA